jgi:hypothetical protein
MKHCVDDDFIFSLLHDITGRSLTLMLQMFHKIKINTQYYYMALSIPLRCEYVVNSKSKLLLYAVDVCEVMS